MLRGDSEHVGQNVTVIYDSLGGFIKREGLAIPNRHACMQLDRIVRLNGSRIGFVELDRGAGESLVRGPARTFDFRLLIRIKMRSEVRLLRAVNHLDDRRSCLPLLKGPSNDDGDILPVVTNDTSFERRPSFIQTRRKPSRWRASENLPHVPPALD